MKYLLRFATASVLLVLGAMCVIGVDGVRDDIQHSDVAIVLGSMVSPGGTPSSRLQARLDKVVSLYRQGAFTHVIVSGGTGVEGVNEAVVMHDYLVSKQVPADAILVDADGITTRATALHSVQLMKTFHLRSAMVVTQYFHVTRTRAALHAAGVETVHTAHADYFELRDIYSLAREVVAVPAYWIQSCKTQSSPKSSGSSLVEMTMASRPS